MSLGAPCAVEVAKLEAKNAYSREVEARAALYASWPYGGATPREAMHELSRLVRAREQAEERLMSLVRPRGQR